MSEHESKELPLDAVAIVGMAGRFPGAKSVDALWENLRLGRECVTFFSDEELLAAGVDRATLEDPDYVKACPFLEDPDLFDAAFFGMNPREAELTDPQQRHFLEVAWEALESAGYDPERYPGSIGVYGGSSRNNYLLNHLLTNPQVLESMGVVACALANEKDFLATRVSYKLNLRGPSVTVATACSTSLVAIHLGMQALLGGECDMVLAGGSCVSALEKSGYPCVEGGVFSTDGHLRAFDHRASGQVGGNGVAIVVLKRLEDALAAGDSIRAVLRGSALNNDGIKKVSFSAPGVAGQAQVIAEALEVAHVHPEEVSYVECHGTGTQLGDPIEIAALNKAYGARTQAKGYCPIGSLKTNIGHLDAAAAVAAVVKTTLALEHKEIPASLNFEKPNPEIDFESSPFFVNTKLRPWETDKLPRRAGVSSFGMGGTNGHLVLEEAPELPTPSDSRPYQLILLSARSKNALEDATRELALALEAPRFQGPDAPAIADVAYTRMVGRKAFAVRRAVVARDRAEAVDALQRLDPKRTVIGNAPKVKRRAAFLFTGQGAQYPNMMRGLYEAEPSFQAALDRCCEGLKPHLGRDLRELLFPAEDRLEEAAVELKQTQYTQPALFAVEIALARLLADWGIEPVAMLGHSIGEFVAATLASVLTLDEALALVAARGRLIGGLPAGGSMLAVQLAEEELRGELPSELSIAAVNGPELCVASGPEDAVARLEAELTKRAISCRRLHTSHAFHSALMEPALADFRGELAKVTLRPPQQRFVSCSTGTWIRPEEATDPEYWVRHIREAVRFADGVQTLLSEKNLALVEVGPGQGLCSLAQMVRDAASGDAGSKGSGKDTPVLSTTRHPHEKVDDLARLLRAVGELWTQGVDFDPEGFYERERRRRVPLPTYPFQRQRYWVERGSGIAGASPVALGGPELTGKLPDPADWFYTPSWRRRARPKAAGRTDGVWVLFADGSGWARALEDSLTSCGAEIFTVRVGDGFERSGARGYVLDPRNPADYADLLEDLAERGASARHVVHLWGVDDSPRATAADRERIQDLGFYSLLFLAQALGARQAGAELVLDVVTTGMQEVLGGELDTPEKATVLGSVKAINSEFSGVVARSIDFESARRSSAEGAPPELFEELSGAATDPVVAYRSAYRWVLGVESVRLEEPDSDSPTAGAQAAEGGARLREGGVYLVTGGLGGIGLTLARELASSAAAKLVLVGRQGIPDRAGWDAWISEHGEADPTSRKIAAVRELESSGSEVLVVAADVADAEAMTALVREAVARFGAIHGVIHSAGVPGAGLLELKSRGAAKKVLAPKVRGTQVLAEALAEVELDWLMLCSSLATAIVGVGQVDYFAANAYLDAYAHFVNANGGPPTIAVGWDAWREVGMAAETVVPANLREEREANLKTGLTPDEGRDVFRRTLGCGLTQVYVSTRDLPFRIAEIAAAFEPGASAKASDATSAATSTSTTELASESAPDAEKGGHARPDLATEYVAPRTETETAIAGVWADLLGLDRVGALDDVFELGGNSLLLMQLSVRLRGLYGVQVPIRALFELPRVEALAEHVDALRLASDAGGSSAASSSAGETEEFSL